MGSGTLFWDRNLRFSLECTCNAITVATTIGFRRNIFWFILSARGVPVSDVDQVNSKSSNLRGLCIGLFVLSKIFKIFFEHYEPFQFPSTSQLIRLICFHVWSNIIIKFVKLLRNQRLLGWCFAGKSGQFSIFVHLFGWKIIIYVTIWVNPKKDTKSSIKIYSTFLL